jgi:ABC-type antimicrobial peptide transport system permease subunit
LKEPSGFLSLTQRMSDDLQLNSLDARLEVDYWESQSRRFVLFVTLLGGAVAVIFSFGAILGAMITMYAQVAARISEIGTLRAIGFKPRAVLVSFVVESVLMGLLSGALALALAAGMRWVPLSATNWQTQSQIAFHLRLSPGIALASLAFAAFIGYTGGLLPALRAAKAPIVRATRGG